MICGRLHMYRVTQVTYFGLTDPSDSLVVIHKNIVRFDICSPALATYCR